MRVEGAGCRVQGAGCRVQGAGCRVQQKGFAGLFETHRYIVCEQGFTEEVRVPQHVQAYISM